LSPRTIELTDALRDYWLRVMLREPEVLARLRRDTAGMPGAGMQIALCLTLLRPGGLIAIDNSLWNCSSRASDDGSVGIGDGPWERYAQ
jgi:hypothetical protein